MPSPPGAREAAAGGPPESLLRPASAEIDAWIPRLPPRQESGDGRVQHDAVELVRREEPMAAHRLVARHCALERSIELAGDGLVREEARAFEPGVVAGYGNDGASGFEGCRVGRAVGTYLHGPLLPRNPWLADLLLSWAIAHATAGEPEPLAPLHDELEAAAHAVAAGRARSRGGRPA